MSNSRSQSFNLWLGLFVVLLSALLVSQVLLVSAQGTDDTGTVVIGPPAEPTTGGNTATTVTVDTENNIVNTNPANGDPVVTLGGKVAKTKDSDGTGQQVAAFAFGAAHSDVSFSGSIANISTFLADKWARSGAVAADVEMLCLTDDGRWSAENVTATVTVNPATSSYTISGSVDQHGTCAVFVATSASDNGSQGRKDLNLFGISG